MFQCKKQLIKWSSTVRPTLLLWFFAFGEFPYSKVAKLKIVTVLCQIKRHVS